MFSGISLDQAPPFSVPMRFFLTAPLFLVLAGVLMIFTEGELLQNRWSYEALALVHAFSVGFGGMVMLGALTQMLPVLAGVKLRAPLALARVVHGGVSLGALLMVGGFYFALPLALHGAMILLGGAFCLFILALGWEMWGRVEFLNATIHAMRYALLALLGVVASGLVMLWWQASGEGASFQLELVGFHIKIATLGWILLLVVGIAFQVIPMFYVTPDYPLVAKGIGLRVFILILALALVIPFWESSLERPLLSLLAILILGWSGVSLARLSARKRALADVTVRYWQLSLFSIGAFALSWLVALWSGWEMSGWLFALFGVGFTLSVMNGMLYKIIPFLVWFHLSGAGIFSIPSMREMIEERSMWGQFYLHFLALLLLLASSVESSFFALAGGAIALSNLWLGYNLYTAWRIYPALMKGGEHGVA